MAVSVHAMTPYIDSGYIYYDTLIFTGSKTAERIYDFLWTKTLYSYMYMVVCDCINDNNTLIYQYCSSTS